MLIARIGVAIVFAFGSLLLLGGTDREGVAGAILIGAALISHTIMAVADRDAQKD